MTEKELIKTVKDHDKSFVLCMECMSCGELNPILKTDDNGDCSYCVRDRNERNFDMLDEPSN
jgi:uncharacterized Zn finger protein